MTAQTVTETEGKFRLPDGTELYTVTWAPPSSTPTRARLVFIHGFSDHCRGQDPFFTNLANHGITTYSFDQRGWGRSALKNADKGKTGPTTQVLADITAFLNSLPEPSPATLPTFLMGHSMGGQEVLLYATLGDAAARAKIRGFIAEAPFIRLHHAVRPSPITVTLGRLAGKLLPNMHLVNKLDPNMLCRDPKRCEEWSKDPLCHDTGTLEGLAGMLDRAGSLDDAKLPPAGGPATGNILADGAGEGGKTRLLIAHGTSDGICAIEASQEFFTRSTVADKTLKTYDGWFHKLHIEPGQDNVTFAKDVADWISERSAPLDGGAAEAKL